MNCPNCDQKMQDKSYMYYGIGDWDLDYPETCHQECFCKTCDIKYINREWTIPKALQPSEKRFKTVVFILYVLKFPFNPLTKKGCWKYIHENLQDAIEQNEANKLQRAEWMLEEYGSKFEYF